MPLVFGVAMALPSPLARGCFLHVPWELVLRQVLPAHAGGDCRRGGFCHRLSYFPGFRQPPARSRRRRSPIFMTCSQ